MMIAPHVTAPTLAHTPGVEHAFLSRAGGVSKGIYAGLNCGLGSDDNPEDVHENRSRAARILGASPAQLRTLYQVHSARVVDADTAWTGAPPEADALVCTRPGTVIGVLAADCAPVLLADAAAGVIGAAHAGWRGALDGVVAATIAAMLERGARIENMTAAVGPSIGPDSYEVGPEFPVPFLEQDTTNAGFFVEKTGSDRLLFDLPAYVHSRLTLAGVTRSATTGQDTYQDPDFFSYRRSCHRNESDYGRNISIITLRKDV
jgi:polyphenol oxidase